MSEELMNYRKTIDELDYQLVVLMAKRMGVITAVKLFKKENNLEMLDVQRFHSLVQKNKKYAKKFGISESLIESLLVIIHNHALEFLNKE